MYKEIEGNLITMALNGAFDVIAHGCNCFCIMGAGLAPQMAKAFGCDKFELENEMYKGDINKLGAIDWAFFQVSEGLVKKVTGIHVYNLEVVNCYTQYQPGANIDYEALTLCLRKMNHEFQGAHIGLPQIGCGIAEGDWNTVNQIIQDELKDCNITVVIFNR